MKTFQKGDCVHWTSQAGGVHVKKKGVIVEVVPAGTTMKVRDRDRATSRDHESYVVEVAGPTKKSKSRRYWPVATLLKLSHAMPVAPVASPEVATAAPVVAPTEPAPAV